jgi:hypothetical protein
MRKEKKAGRSKPAKGKKAERPINKEKSSNK